jgi:hypothetical protein
MEGTNRSISYVIAKQTVSCFSGHGADRGKRGPQNEGKSYDVIENKCRKNVSSEICNDLDENKQVVAL